LAVSFINTLIKQACDTMKLDDVDKIKSMVTVVFNQTRSKENDKKRKGKTAGTVPMQPLCLCRLGLYDDGDGTFGLVIAAGKKKASVNVDAATSAAGGDYDDYADDYDFM